MPRRAPDLGEFHAVATRALAGAEAAWFRVLNQVMEPAVRAGWGSPGLVPTGLVVVETKGERSGRPRRAPLLATLLDGCLVVSTFRAGRAQWARNMRAAPDVRYWLAGRPRAGRARVFAPGVAGATTVGLPPLARLVADCLLAPATAFGWTFAVISDRGRWPQPREH